MKKLFLPLLLSGLLPLSTRAQQPRRSVTAAKRFTLPVSPRTGRITYQDTIRVPGASVEKIRDAVYNAFFNDFMYVDFRSGMVDTTRLLKPSDKPGPGEELRLGSIMMQKPGEPVPLYVAGVSPEANMRSAAPIHYLNFVLRMRTEPGVCYLTITDLHQRNTTMQADMDRWVDAHARARKGDLTPPAPPPPDVPAETLYAAWLPGAKMPPAAGKTAPTLPDAKLLDSSARTVLRALRYRLTQ